MLNVFDDVLFDTHGQDSQLKKYDGCYGTIVRELSEKECDIEEVERMYAVDNRLRIEINMEDYEEDEQFSEYLKENFV